MAGAEPHAGISTGGQSADCCDGGGRPRGRRSGQPLSPVKGVDIMWSEGGRSAPPLEGTETMERMRALQTPLQQTTVGSGLKLRTQTWVSNGAIYILQFMPYKDLIPSQQNSVTQDVCDTVTVVDRN